MTLKIFVLLTICLTAIPALAEDNSNTDGWEPPPPAQVEGSDGWEEPPSAQVEGWDQPDIEAVNTETRVTPEDNPVLTGVDLEDTPPEISVPEITPNALSGSGCMMSTGVATSFQGGLAWGFAFLLTGMGFLRKRS